MACHGCASSQRICEVHASALFHCMQHMLYVNLSNWDQSQSRNHSEKHEVEHTANWTKTEEKMSENILELTVTCTAYT